MTNQLLGIHHVTAITDDPQKNIDFYVGVLGLHLVKKTVNFDVPDTYHLYYGDNLGTPGTILTFFSWPDSPKGRRGTGQVTTTSFVVPENSLVYWQERLKQQGVQVAGPTTRFDEQVLTFTDHEGLGLELVAHKGAEQRTGWTTGPVPIEYAIRGIHAVTLSITRKERTVSLLTQTLGFRLIGETGNRTRYEVGTGDNAGSGAFVDVLDLPHEPRGVEAIGSVHHVAWRITDDEQELAWRKVLVSAGVSVTPQLDRVYFQSIYFHEPNGVLFEIATDSPGFAIDEAPAELGTRLKLPPWLESQRPQLERDLPLVHSPFETPGH